MKNILILIIMAKNEYTIMYVYVYVNKCTSYMFLCETLIPDDNTNKQVLIM